ncbi:MAG: transcription antitermination factor NusB [Armatimonadota bacterium]
MSHKPSGSIKKLRLARELALRMLYKWELSEEITPEDIEEAQEHFALDDDAMQFAKSIVDGVTKEVEEIDAKILEFCKQLVDGVCADVDHIDAMIEARSVGWPISRQPLPDRNIVRIAVWELINRPETSEAIIISEAVELSKKYSDDDASRFVNGLLAGILQDVRPDAVSKTKSN